MIQSRSISLGGLLCCCTKNIKQDIVNLLACVQFHQTIFLKLMNYPEIPLPVSALAEKHMADTWQGIPLVSGLSQ